MFTDSLRRGVEGIVLDAVGTLIDPVPGVAEAYRRAAVRQGVDLDPADVRARFRRHFRADSDDATPGSLATDEAAEHRRWRRIVAQVLPELPDPDRGFEELWDHFADPAAWRCFPDVAPALEAWRRSGVRVCVGSNFDARLRRVVAGLPELARLADALVISSEVGHRKPHPSFFAAACERLGLAPSQVLVVGDDVVNDVVGPRDAGLRGVLVERDGFEPGGELPRVASLVEVAALWD